MANLNGSLTDKQGMGLIKIENGKVVVINPIDGNKPAKILPCDEVQIIVDGREVISPIEVFEENNIEIKAREIEAKRELDVSISEDIMEARISLKYIPKEEYKLKDTELLRELKPTVEYVGETMPPKYTEVQIINELSNLGIIYGIDEEAVKRCCKEENIVNLVIARGKEAALPIDDEIEVLFQSEFDKKLAVDEKGTVDFKSIGEVEVVHKGDVIARLKEGQEGTVGFNVYGQLQRPKKRKEKKIFANNGCKLKDNLIIATIDGKPHVKGNMFSVEQVHQVNGDVDISTGNIKFIGDIIVYGDVKEGMTVEAGHELTVNSNVLRAELKAVGNITVKGNVISSSIIVGSESLDYSIYINELESFQNLLGKLYDNLVKVNHKKMITNNISDRELVKFIVESRFRNFENSVKKLLSIMEKRGEIYDSLYAIVKNKLDNSYFSNILTINEIKQIQQMVIQKLNSVKVGAMHQSNLTANYVQDSKVSSTGSVYINGKGVYKSEINALDSVYFIAERSTTRGGIINAANEIKCKIVGTIAGVSTILKVKRSGHIYADTAYYNTKFIVGEKEYLLEEPSRNIHAYLDSDRELVVDKFKL
ncbi:MAG: DUF342 domain-containing protein [Clostridium argentinense]|uniref:DUF342 domain-containing protein n=1 Tax=Clostridium butanoliproducens TaxID=2991837 RepID=UPI001DF8CB38|nr:FapA family protein [Clostridium butanoliproducens]MBS5823932.1 DUF342 domain-containing protein [Clostridium argentinense]MDU1349527.1 FapA family protein [Clostridium argentinense]